MGSPPMGCIQASSDRWGWPQPAAHPRRAAERIKRPWLAELAPRRLQELSEGQRRLQLLAILKNLARSGTTLVLMTLQSEAVILEIHRCSSGRRAAAGRCRLRFP